MAEPDTVTAAEPHAPAARAEEPITKVSIIVSQGSLEGIYLPLIPI